MDEPWSQLTAEEVLEEFNAGEKGAVDSVKGTDDLVQIVGRVIELVRDAYRSGGRPLGEDGSIPAGLKPRAIAIARWNFITSIPGTEQLQNKERKAANDEAMRYLEQIAKREIKGSGSAQSVSGTRQATRDKLNGLI